MSKGDEMQLSEMIALGRTLCLSVPGTQDDYHGGGCALGMAARAMDKRSFDGGYALTELNCAEVLLIVVRPCSCLVDLGFWNNKLGGIIAHLFNMHVHGDKTWTLDQLIDWVRSVEPAETIETEAVTCAPSIESFSSPLSIS